MDDLEKVFLGKITAGMTHEINNVLATIREATGLMKDLVQASKDLPPELSDRLVTVTERVVLQVDRGSRLTSRLNRYAHTLDVPKREEDVDEWLQLAVDLNQRFARLKRLELKNLPLPVPRRLPVPTFHLLLAFSSSLTWLMDHSAPNSEITISASPADDLLAVHIMTLLSDPAKAVDAGFHDLEKTLRQLLTMTGIHLDMDQASDRLVLKLECPLSRD